MLELKPSKISQVQIDNEKFFMISNVSEMRPFFMSIVSNSNHWMFISSNGGLSAGRRDSENALFPYYTDDKITESAEFTGSKSLFWVNNNGQTSLWGPFSERHGETYNVSRNLYKNILGNKVLFEEVNHDLNLTFRYQWNSSDKYGFVRKSYLINDSDEELEIAILDGIQNIMPYGVGSFLQNQSSNLVDAYKRNQLEKEAGLGIYALSAIIVDKAEPSEALQANIAWSIGFREQKHLLSSTQLSNFIKGIELEEELDVMAEKGAYFIHSETSIPKHSSKEWIIVTEVSQNHSDVAKILDDIKHDQNLLLKINEDIEQGCAKLIELNAAADALQLTQDKYRDTRHFSNTLFNIMRGGIFDQNYQIEKWDLLVYFKGASKKVYKQNRDLLQSLPDLIAHSDLISVGMNNEDKDLRRLCLEYMPLKFSRRHGDPSRPWNKFSINTRNEIDGSKILDYEGNWRDIFQNWEALAISYPEFIESMIHKFLNATTFDGYNPYRVTKSGFDWESIEPDDPWSFIGYWGDHQIIYLLKLLEISNDHHPGKLASYLKEDFFVYAHVPYRIKNYEDILKNPKDTIDFDFDLDHKIREKRANEGADGALLESNSKHIYGVNFVEKILATVLAKLSNFIPEAGIWMNTQRPEWNDANNALVGNGVSMVTLYYLRRFLKFIQGIINESDIRETAISAELISLFNSLHSTFENHKSLLSGKFNDKERKSVVDELGRAASDYRQLIYQNSFSNSKNPISFKQIEAFINLSLEFLEHTIRENKRQDNLYHAYNLMTLTNENGIAISHLDEMLEGQVSVLSSGLLTSQEALSVLDGLKSSKLFRADQFSYLLYPFKNLPRFIEKNVIPHDSVDASKLMQSLAKDENRAIVEKDISGTFHFNGNFKNANDLEKALNQLSTSKYGDLLKKEKSQILGVFEDIFDHKSFTGRSGTFYGYEGLGSIYWHMVSKLQLATLECCFKAFLDEESEETKGRLLEHYYEINEGIGVHKSPTLYGAFPTDPYSHTPAGKGAQQPGMTGQVKEDILSRFGELGIVVRAGKIHFLPFLLRKTEFLSKADVFDYLDVESNQKQIPLEKGMLSFTYCQVPFVYKKSDRNKLEVQKNDGSILVSESLFLETEISKMIFKRTGEIKQVMIELKASDLR